MNLNRNFKASIFSDLFSNPDILRELYCALEGVTLPDNIPVTINTLEDVLFMDQINDISFEIDGKLVILIEHQSSINPNIALRLLMYIARVYEKITDDKNLYSEKQIPVPRPEFFVLYNGKAPYEEQAVLKLSDSFEKLTSLGITEKETPALELEVKIININDGKNNELVEKCKTLAHYRAFVSKVREFEKEANSHQEAVKKAIYYCRDHDILKEYLENKASEVLNMLITEWNWDDAKEVWQAEALEKGYEQGIEKGLEKGRMEIARKMKTRGKSIDEIAEDTGLQPETIEIL